MPKVTEGVGVFPQMSHPLLTTGKIGPSSSSRRYLRTERSFGDLLEFPKQ